MRFIIVTLLFVLSGCSPNQLIAEESTQRVENVDYRLYQVPVRGNVIPGIEIDERESAAALCGTRVLEGVGDVVRNDEELKERKLITEWAADYNKKMYKHCQKVKLN